MLFHVYRVDNQGSYYCPSNPLRPRLLMELAVNLETEVQQVFDIAV